jgi:hypothetical protein
MIVYMVVWFTTYMQSNRNYSAILATLQITSYVHNPNAFLSNRTQQVIVEGATSDTVPSLVEYLKEQS